jgi:hypothetical protein
MTDARCERCTEKKVGIADIIHAGHGDRYQVFKCCSFLYQDEFALVIYLDATLDFLAFLVLHVFHY